MTEAESEIKPEQAKTETETDRLNKQLDAIKKQSKELNINVAGAANNLNYKKFLATSNPILSLNIPNDLFLLWNKRNKLESKLGVAQTSLTSLTADSLGNFIRINPASATLMQRLKNKQSRFLANYRKSGGAKQKQLHTQSTNMILLQEEVISSSSIINRSQVTIATYTYIPSYIAIFCMAEL